jgi:hypothetical protein
VSAKRSTILSYSWTSPPEFGDREEEWTHSIAVGSQPIVESMKNLLGIRAKGREVIEGAKGYQLREEAAGYQAHFEVQNSDIGLIMNDHE